jgi:thioredoxin
VVREPTGLMMLTSENWDRQVLGSPVPFAVGFFAEWCVPCRTMSPALQGAAAALWDRMRFGQVDVEASPELAVRCGIQGLPTLLIFTRGEEVQRRVGLMAREDLFELLESRAAGSARTA